MLESTTNNESTSAAKSAASDDQLLRPPAGRRSRTRPAGPPAPVTDKPKTTVTQAAESKPVKAAAPKAAAATSAEPATSDAKVSTPRRNTRKKAVSPSSEATGNKESAAKDGAAKKPSTRRTRSSRGTATRATASVAADDASNNAQSAADPVEAAISAVMAKRSQADSSSQGDESSQTDRPARSTRTRKSAGNRSTAKRATTSKPTSDQEMLDAVLDAAEKAAPRGRRRTRSTSSATSGGNNKQAALDSLASAIAQGEQAADAHDKAEQDPGNEAKSERKPNARKPRNARDRDEADDETRVDEAQSADSDESSDSNDGEEGTHRRRRRRGGRRRRRSSDDLNDSQNSDDSGSDDSDSQAKESNGSRSGSGKASGKDSQDDHDADSESETDSNGTQHRRRRRRRRHGEDGDAGPADMPVRVREPRHHGSDGVTGIQGSTRLEAKRQRRKEGRAAGRRRAPILSEAEFLARRESVDRKMIIRQRADYTQLAVLEDGLLVEHYVDRKASASLIGNIYLGKVQNVLPSMEAAFIDIGRGRNAVLYAGEVNWDSMETGHKGSRRIEDALKPGQTVLVQASKDPIGAKGARLTGHISLPGRYLVYSPDGHLSGISRKLSDRERHRLKDIVNSAIDDSSSVIVRTAAEGVTEEELRADIERLKAHWEVIEQKVAAGHSPQQLYVEPDLTLRIVRDLFTEDFNALIVEGDGGPEDAFETVHEYVEHVAPTLVERLEHWDTAEGDLFTKYRLDEQISKALERKVFLPSGGSLVIDRTEAMTVIDVNTGKFTGAGGNLEETVTKNNLEAADEIVRQMRLRDLGGMIVVDFIDMVLPANRELLLRRLVECLGRDRTRHQVGEVTSLGLVQMTRKRIGTGLAEAFTEECEHCGGRGYVRHDEPVATQAPADGGERHHRSGGGRKARPKKQS